MIYRAYFKQMFKQYKIPTILSLVASTLLYPLIYIALTPREVVDIYRPYNELVENTIQYIDISVFYISLIAIVLFSGLLTNMYYHSNAVDFMNVLPMNKQKRKLTEILFGWCVIFIPMIIGCVIVSLYYLTLSDRVINCYGLNAVKIISSLNLFYFICMFVFSLCSSTKEALVNMSGVMVILALLPTSLWYLISNTTINTPYYDFLYQESFNLFGFIIYFIRSIISYNFIYTETFDLMLSNLTLLTSVQIVFSIIICSLICYFAKFKKSENTGGIRKNYILYYICVGLMGFVILCLYSSPYVSKRILYLSMILGFGIITLLFEISFKNVVRTLCVLVISLVCFISCRQVIIQTEFFSSYRSYRELENVEHIEVDLGSEDIKTADTNSAKYVRRYIELEDKDDIKNALSVFSDFQDLLVDDFKENLGKKPESVQEHKYIGFYYTIKDEKTTADYVYDLDSKEYLKFHILCEKNDIEIKEEILTYEK